MTSLPPSLLLAGAVMCSAGLAGWLAAGGLVPRSRDFAAERIAWGMAAGLVLLAAPVPLALAFGARPGWPWHALVAVAAVAAGRVWRLTPENPAPPRPPRRPRAVWWLLAITPGLALYALWALTEPMWSNDFLAIWGLKGKLVFETGTLPRRLFEDASLRFSHPEYPLGLPFLFAGIATLMGRWDDHAMALLYPLVQAATVAAASGWLLRRGTSGVSALGAAALLSFAVPLYSAFHTGLADVPLAFGVLLLGCAWSDALDGTDRGAVRRLAAASALAAATKNEGLVFVGLALAATPLLARLPRRATARIAAALALPAAAVWLAHRVWRGRVPLKDFDLGLLRPSRWEDLGPRLVEALAAAAAVAAAAWPILLALAMLAAAGRRRPFADRLLLLAGGAAAVYLLVPALGIHPADPALGPVFLVQTALGRTMAALSPLLAAGIAGRLD